MFEEQRESNILYQRYDRGCTREFDACHQNAEASGGTEQARTSCGTHFFRGDVKIEGPCPKLLAKVEATSDDTIEQLLAKIALRGYFREVRTNDRIRYVPFRKEDSLTKLRRLLSEQPTNLYAQHLIASNFTEIEEEYEELAWRVELLQHDHLCDTALNYELEIVLRQYLHYFGSYTRGINPESKLQPDEMANITKKVWDAIMSTYLDLWDYGPPYRDITLAYRITNPLVIVDADEERKIFYDLLGDKREGDFEKTLRNTRREVIELYSINSGAERTTQLKTICDDYSFEMGLVNECLKLIQHYGTADVSDGMPLKKDLYEALMRLLLAVTRTCDDSSRYALRLGMRSIGFGTCFHSTENQVTSEIESVLLKHDSVEFTLYENILWSYVHLDFRSLDHFIRALSTNIDALEHVLPLTRRLVERGKRDAALAIVNEGISAARKIPLDEQFLYTHKIKSTLSHMTLVSQFQYSIHQESDLVALLQIVLDQVKSGHPIEYHEAPFGFGG